MKVREYTCQECEYTKTPTTHVDCGGNIIKKAGEWRCDACGVKPIEETVCSRCDATVVDENIEVIEMKIDG